MNKFQVRRASVDDLSGLVALWRIEHLDWASLEKRLTEFQVVESEGDLQAAVGLRIKGVDGKIHNEAIARPELADALRMQLWSRLEGLARNYGLCRIWTQLGAPFWRQCGFQPVTEEHLEQLPTDFTDTGFPWLLLRLKDEEVPGDTVEKQFALLKAVSREETDRLMRRGKALKLIAALLMLGLFGGLATYVVYALKLRPLIHRKR